jgi:Ca2+-binding EF-hand superfamily protein
LHSILTQEEKFAEINKSIFDAIDTDNSGTLERDDVESFVKSLLVGVHTNEEDYDAKERHRIVFGVLDENESGEITLDELGKFLRELFKEQIKELQDSQERMKRRAVASNNNQGNTSLQQ